MPSKLVTSNETWRLVGSSGLQKQMDSAHKVHEQSHPCPQDSPMPQTTSRLIPQFTSTRATQAAPPSRISRLERPLSSLLA